VADLESRPAAVRTVSVKARLAAAGLGHGAARPDPPPAPDGGEQASARVAEARSRARERGDRQRQALRPLGVAFLAVVLTASAQTHPAPALHGADLAVTLVLVVYAAAVLTSVSVGWARRGPAAQAAVIALIGGCGVALAVVQPHGPVEGGQPGRVDHRGPAASRPGRGRRRGDHGSAGGGGRPDRTARPRSAVTAVLLCLRLAVTGQFIRRGRQSRDRTELLLAQRQDARAGPDPQPVLITRPSRRQDLLVAVQPDLPVLPV
jgi:hypothetical protein